MTDPTASLPPGFTIDAQDPHAALPPGFTIDQPAASPGFFEGVTNAAQRAATLGLTDQVSGLVNAQGAIPHELKRGINALASSLGYDAPFTVDPNEPGFRQLYGEGVDKERAKAKAFRAQGPAARIGSAVASILGGATLAGPGMAPNGAAVETARVAPTLLGRVGQGATVGGGIGAVAGAADAPDLASVPKSAVAGGIGGGVLGGSAPVAVEAVTPVFQAIARRFNPGAVETQADARIARALGADEAAGGKSAADIAAELQGSSKPLAIADVADANVRGLAGQVTRAPGEGRQFATQTLNDRDAAAGPRLMADVAAGVSNGKSAFSTVEDLMAARQAASAPLYAKALSVGPVSSPEIDGLTQNSAIIRRTIASVKANFPAFANLAPNDMRLLDEAYKQVGGQAQAARQAGNGPLAYKLDELRTSFRTALTDANPTYGQALDAFSGPSQSMRAVDLGRNVFRNDPGQTASELASLSQSDRDFYLLGAADTMRQRIASSSSGADEARRIAGNDLLKQQLRPLFSTQQGYDDFIKAAADESRMFATRRALTGGSDTAARLAQDQGEGGPGIAGPLIQGAVALHAGEPVLGAAAVGRGAKALFDRLETADPAVNAAVSRALLSTDPATRMQTIARLLNAAPDVPSSRLAAALAAQLGGTALPSLDRATNAGR